MNWDQQLAVPNRTWAQVKQWKNLTGYSPTVVQLAAMLEGSPLICQGVIAEQNFLHNHGVNSCMHSVLVPNQKGYRQPSLFGKKPMVLHKIAYIAANGNPPPGLEISHLCHNPACCKPAHLFAELGLPNNARKGCAVWVMCPHQHPNNQQRIVWVCGHGNPTLNKPYCIKNHPANVFVDNMDGLRNIANGWCCG